MYHTGIFIKGDSLIHLMDPRIKLAAVVVLSIMILGVKPAVVFIIGFALICAVYSSSISFRNIGQALKPLLFFVGLIFLSIYFSAKTKRSQTFLTLTFPFPSQG